MLQNTGNSPIPLNPLEESHQINLKEFNTVIKAKKEIRLEPNKIPNEIFIEANLETKKTLKTMIEKAHIAC